MLEHTLDIPPATDKTVEEVLDALQGHIKSLHNEALHRRKLLGRKQFEGESFSDFYVWLKHIAEELDVCPGASSTHDNPHGCERQGTRSETHLSRHDRFTTGRGQHLQVL